MASQARLVRRAGGWDDDAQKRFARACFERADRRRAPTRPALSSSRRSSCSLSPRSPAEARIGHIATPARAQPAPEPARPMTRLSAASRSAGPLARGRAEPVASVTTGRRPRRDALERGPHRGTGTMQEHALVRGGDAEALAYLRRIPPLDISQADHPLMAVGQLGDRRSARARVSPWRAAVPRAARRSGSAARSNSRRMCSRGRGTGPGQRCSPALRHRRRAIENGVVLLSRTAARLRSVDEDAEDPGLQGRAALEAVKAAGSRRATSPERPHRRSPACVRTSAQAGASCGHVRLTSSRNAGSSPARRRSSNCSSSAGIRLDTGITARDRPPTGRARGLSALAGERPEGVHQQLHHGLGHVFLMQGARRANRGPHLVEIVARTGCRTRGGAPPRASGRAAACLRDTRSRARRSLGKEDLRSSCLRSRRIHVSTQVPSFALGEPPCGARSRFSGGTDEHSAAGCNDSPVRETVVIVDDNAAFRAQARVLLTYEGYDVIGEASDGPSGLDVVAGCDRTWRCSTSSFRTWTGSRSRAMSARVRPDRGRDDLGA